jgi:hypothetical protein
MVKGQEHEMNQSGDNGQRQRLRYYRGSQGVDQGSGILAFQNGKKCLIVSAVPPGGHSIQMPDLFTPQIKSLSHLLFFQLLR